MRDGVRGEDGVVLLVLFIIALFLFDVVLSIVLGTAADVSEGLQAWGGRCVCVDVDSVTAFDILEKSHRGISCVVLHHFRVGLTRSHIVGRVLEDASLAIGAFGWMFHEVLAD